jgi:hypothetical protein
MKYFSFSLDDETDAYDPLGNITIHGDEGAIVAECVMLDTFLGALVTGSSLVGEGDGGEIHVDVVDEPDELCFSRGLTEMKIRYAGQSATVENKLVFEEELRDVVIGFLGILDSHSRSTGARPLDFSELRRYARNA